MFTQLFFYPSLSFFTLLPPVSIPALTFHGAERDDKDDGGRRVRGGREGYRGWMVKIIEVRGGRLLTFHPNRKDIKFHKYRKYHKYHVSLAWYFFVLAVFAFLLFDDNKMSRKFLEPSLCCAFWLILFSCYC